MEKCKITYFGLKIYDTDDNLFQPWLAKISEE